MPELPEVEVVRRSLQSFINGLKIQKVTIFNRNLRYKISRDFKKVVQGQKITSILRKGKFLLIRLKNKKIIIIHLCMTGKIFIKTQKNIYKSLTRTHPQLRNNSQYCSRPIDFFLFFYLILIMV